MKTSSLEHLRVEYDWIEAFSMVRSVLTIVWCLVMGLLCYMFSIGGNVLWASLFGLLIIIALYIILALVSNKTVFLVSPELVASHGPLPWFGGFEIKTAEIGSILWKASGRDDVALTRGTYTFYFNLLDGKKVSIFAVVPICEYRPALETVIAIQEWLAPYHKIEIIRASGLHANTPLQTME